MRALLDTGFLYAVFDATDQHHTNVVQVLSNWSGELLLPTAVLVELAYLLQTRLGHQTMRGIMQRLMSQSLYLVPITSADLIRINEVLSQYGDAKLDFVDSVIVTLAERLQVHHILTVDRRDFAIIRPLHCAYFELLP
jgi:predicted nucleic acid-binding protein